MVRRFLYVPLLLEVILVFVFGDGPRVIVYADFQSVALDLSFCRCSR